jgi:hypothetical protein
MIWRTILAVPCCAALAACAQPNWDLSNTEYTAYIEYTFTTSPFPLSDSDSDTGPLTFGPQDEEGRLEATVAIPIGGQLFPITVDGQVEGDNLHLFTVEPVPGPYEYDTEFQIGPLVCHLHIVATNIVADLNVHIAGPTTLDSGAGTITCDLVVTSPDCYVPPIDSGYVDITTLTAEGGPAAKYMQLSGTATLQNYAGDPAARPLTLSFAGPTPRVETVTVDGLGAWSLRTALVPGTYTLDFWALYYLHRKLWDVALEGDTGGLDALLLGGDANGSNDITILDLNELLLGFGDPQPDPDGSGLADLPDLVLVLVNFGAIGD